MIFDNKNKSLAKLAAWKNTIRMKVSQPPIANCFQRIAGLRTWWSLKVPRKLRWATGLAVVFGGLVKSLSYAKNEGMLQPLLQPNHNIFRNLRNYLVIKYVLRNDAVVSLLASILNDLMEHEHFKAIYVKLFIMLIDNPTIQDELGYLLRYVLYMYMRSEHCTTNLAWILALNVLHQQQVRQATLKLIEKYVDIDRKRYGLLLHL